MLDESIIIRFFQCMNSRNQEQLDHLLDSNARFYFPKTQPLIGSARILRFFKILFKQYPQLSFQIQRIIVQGNQAAVHWTNEGINRRDEPYQNEGVTVLETKADKIAFISDFFKNTEKF